MSRAYQFRRTTYGNSPVCGRKLCTHPSHAGPRWLHEMEFQTAVTTKRGVRLRTQSWCRTCSHRYEAKNRAKVKRDPARLAARRLSNRMYWEGKRRAAGKPQRGPNYGMIRRYPLPTGRGYSGTRTPLVDAGPLLEVFERWRAVRQGEMERERGDIGVVAIDELLGASGARAISRARQTGRMEIATADRILYAMNSYLSIHDLWPDA
jgi:hypothetical protein